MFLDILGYWDNSKMWFVQIFVVQIYSEECHIDFLFQAQCIHCSCLKWLWAWLCKYPVCLFPFDVSFCVTTARSCLDSLMSWSCSLLPCQHRSYPISDVCVMWSFLTYGSLCSQLLNSYIKILLVLFSDCFIAMILNYWGLFS